ncbi:MAG: hypothetical protein ACR2ND_04285 [Solirubrobacteraceae bacterium]
MDAATLTEIADLTRTRNAIDERIATITRRPALAGHIGDWIAAGIFDIAPEASATAKAIDGRFRSGPLAGKTVNIKTYGEREGILDTTDDPILNYYLVLCGPRAVSMTSKRGTRPWCITNVYLFDAKEIRADQVARNIKRGTASRHRAALWTVAAIYPNPAGNILPLTPAQQTALAQFAPDES